jgi:hypothetical protein
MLPRKETCGDSDEYNHCDQFGLSDDQVGFLIARVGLE